VVFLDYSLPGRDGLEVLGEIRRGEAPPPVVLVTGRGDEQVAVKAMKGGAYDYVVKGEGYLQRLPVVARRAVEANRLSVERKRAEKALRENEDRLRTVVEASLDAIIAVNAEGRLVLFNSAAQELFQYSEEEALNQPADILLREEIGKIHQKRLESFLKKGVGRCGHIGRRMEKPFCRKDGTLFEAEVSMSAGRLNGLRLVVLAIHDITDRKQAEEALRRAEENFRRSLDDSPLGVRIVTIEGETLYANRAILDIYGYDSLEELRTTPVRKRYTPESYAEFQIRMEKRKRGGDVSEYDINIVRKDGEIRHLQVFRKEILWDGERQFQALYNDITDRKREEEVLRDREEELASIYENAPLIMLLVDKEWTIRKTNAFTAQFVGRAVGDMINLRCGESLHCIHSLDAPEGCGFGPSCGECTLRLTAINTIETGQGHHEMEARMSLSDAEKKREAIFLLSTARLTIKGQPMALVSMQDITERKQAEEALHLSEENFRRSLDESPLGVCIVTIEGETLYANRAILDIYGYDSIEELRTTPVKKRYTPESYAEFQVRMEKRKREDNVPEYDISIVRKDGEIRHLHVFRKDVLWDGERQFQVLYNDITDRKQAEERIHASLREKEMLLKEVHHRVRNNMQVISGLLDLQASLSENPELTEMLNESQSRIRSMALIHEKLYGSKDFARTDLAGYVRTLSQELFQTYKINPGKIDLIVQTDGDVYVDINKAIPCGLILNELISNALKHAFPSDGPHELRIIIHETKNKEIEIVVSDNGLGLPDDVDIREPRTAGLHLVNGLVKNQLDGQIEVRRDNGTEFRIKFPL
jgi:PAS domain S-box-containing protein